MVSVQTNSVDSTLMQTMNGGSSTKSVADQAQDRFMTLLVTQMKNQDPLNPMDNAQVTSQLAQLSTVSGIDKLNSSVAAMNANFQVGQGLQAANLIGHGVAVNGNAMSLNKGSAVLGINLPQDADRVDISILDGTGAVVRNIAASSMASGINTLSWDGKSDSGAALADGQYLFKVAATKGTQKLDASTLSFDVVASVASNAQGTKLNFKNIPDVNLSDVQKIY